MALLEPIRKEMEMLHFLALPIKIQMPYTLTLWKAIFKNSQILERRTLIPLF